MRRAKPGLDKSLLAVTVEWVLLPYAAAYYVYLEAKKWLRRS